MRENVVINLCEIIRSRTVNKINILLLHYKYFKSKRGLLLNMFRGGGKQKQKAFLTLQPLY